MENSRNNNLVIGENIMAEKYNGLANKGNIIKDVFDTWMTSEITCPYCGYKDPDSWEYNSQLDHGEIEISCDRCEKIFKCSIDFEISYTTSKIREK